MDVERHIEYLVRTIDAWRMEKWLDETVRDNLIAAVNEEIQRLKGGKKRQITGSGKITADRTRMKAHGNLQDFPGWLTGS